MRACRVFINKSALDDIDDVAEGIFYVSKSISIAEKYIDGLYAAIQKLSIYGAYLPLCQNEDVIAKYGKYIRRMNYKKIAVLFYVNGDTVLIQEIRFQYTIKT